MKKFLSLLLIPLSIACLMLFGCGKDRNVTDIKLLFNDLKAVYTVKEEDTETNIFFSDSARPDSLVIFYPQNVKEAIENDAPANDFQYRYKLLSYEQKILNNIFAYYEHNKNDFYLKADSKLSGSQLTSFYDNLSNLKSTLSGFKQNYIDFINATNIGISDIMKFDITSYTYKLNNVIDASFRFIFEMHSLYSGYCLDDYSALNATNAKVFVDKANLDIAYIVYLVNIKAFNFSVENNGVCDLSNVLTSESEYNLLKLLDTSKTLNARVEELIGDENVDKSLKEFMYSRDVYEQRLSSFVSNYNSLDMYKISKYKFGIEKTTSYESYIGSLSASDRATVQLLDNFIKFNFTNYVDKLNEIAN